MFARTAALVLLASMLCASGGAMAGVKVADAYARGGDGKWTIGSNAVEVTFEARNGELMLSGFTNKLTKPWTNYIGKGDAVNPLGAGVGIFNEKYKAERVWEKAFTSGTKSIDLAEENIRLNVKKGDLIGFAVGPHGEYFGDEIDWTTAVKYVDGESYASADAPELNQGPIWFYCVNAPGTGLLEQIDSVEFAADLKQSFRIPTDVSGFRAPGSTPNVGSTVMHPSPDYDGVRVWKAPKDGVVTLGGVATHIGNGDQDIKVIRFTEKPAAPATTKAEAKWTLVKGEARRVVTGGQPAVQLDLTLAGGSSRVLFHVLAYPGAPILRQWAEIENTGTDPLAGNGASICTLAFNPGGDAFTNYWMVGGNSRPNQGQMLTGEIGVSYNQAIGTNATSQFVPWMGFRRNNGNGDGCFVSLDFVGNWRLAAARTNAGPVRVSAESNELMGKPIEPGTTLALPPVFYGVFTRDLDDMAERLYDWQYTYLWDYTNDEWYAKMPFTVAWYGDSDNLQQQWAGHLGDLDMSWTDLLRTTGMELLWEDAGWSACRTWPEANMEGPDFAETNRYLRKNDMKLIVWIPGHQTNGLLDTKVGAWGDFQRRTDGMGFDAKADRIVRDTASKFLRDHPRSSYHTCSGGSTYAHTFEIQRLMDVNYDSDPIGSDYTNAYWSYLETPDKWFDNLNNSTYSPQGVVYSPDTGARSITQVVKWGLYMGEESIEPERKLCDLYRYLREQGVAGRWSHITHPAIDGDDERHYCQRVSYDRRRSLIILKHRSTGEVTIRPRGLDPKASYLVEFEVQGDAVTRTGAELMANGISIRDQKPGELIYLNLPNRPRSGKDKTPPSAPGRVLVKRETNIGYTGVGIYWSPGSDDNWIGHYEVRRGTTVLGKASVGTYFFDRTNGWSPSAGYAVRTVDGDGNVSPWKNATRLPDAALTASAMGGLFPEQGRESWRYETTTDGKTFVPMTWVRPLNRPSADMGGTTIQPGGAEGYWEGAGTARIGRGWQQASVSAQCVRSWTAPESGSVRITAHVAKDFFHRNKGAQELRIRVVKGDEQIYPQTGWATVRSDDYTGFCQDTTTTVKAGDVLRFVLDAGSDPEHDIIGWMPRISYTGATAPTTAGKAIRILCGADKDYSDGLGNVWSADKWFIGGETTSTRSKIEGTLPTTADQSLYQRGRQGNDFAYSIPVAPGLYTVHLKFAEPKFQYFFARPFSVTINGKAVMTNSDICQAARGWKTAHERDFYYVASNADGKIDIRFTGGWEPGMKTDKALVNAIEVLPEFRPTVRVDCGADRDYIDWSGFVWEADKNTEGAVLTSDATISQASPTLYDQSLYRTARTGRKLTYSFALPDGLYNVHLKFAEMWLKETGRRPMDIEINGRLFWKGWDPSTQAGKTGMSADIRAEDIVPDKNGRITVTITATGSNDAILQGIEIE